MPDRAFYLWDGYSLAIVDIIGYILNKDYSWHIMHDLTSHIILINCSNTPPNLNTMGQYSNVRPDCKCRSYSFIDLQFHCQLLLSSSKYILPQWVPVPDQSLSLYLLCYSCCHSAFEAWPLPLYFLSTIECRTILAEGTHYEGIAHRV